MDGFQEIVEKKPRIKHGRNSRSRARKRHGGPHIICLDLMTRRSERLTVEDTQSLTDQLGYIPYNVVEVSSRDINNTPQSALIYPLNSNPSLSGRYAKGIKPFPTIMWLTSPILKAKISRLEYQGWITKLQHRLHHSELSETYMRQMELAHKYYKEERWNMMTSNDKEYVDQNGWTSALHTVGIAGIRNIHQVKCLHCHYAHYLTRPQHGNIVGEWVHELLKETNTEIEIETDLEMETEIEKEIDDMRERENKKENTGEITEHTEI
mmetsp:Transcript_9306/g.9383  ORF Transcript_9306/g.9383 Transcript_9306/m.9383 type:complete len:266 (-) Transcript_9306:270-1067(-)